MNTNTENAEATNAAPNPGDVKTNLSVHERVIQRVKEVGVKDLPDAVLNSITADVESRIVRCTSRIIESLDENSLIAAEKKHYKDYCEARERRFGIAKRTRAKRKSSKAKTDAAKGKS
ncbi:MAG: hypothetical protein SFV32_07140 [Opitutaceae bacterium]|nr:hypothetical protein [Opitutaceae bacterium]